MDCKECGGDCKGHPETNTEVKSPALKDGLENFKALYIAVNEMMMHMGIHGEITTRDDKAADVMEALFNLDGGEYNINNVF